MELLKFVFSSVWVFLGVSLMGGSVLKYLFCCWNRLLRHLNVRKAGWPPPHLDADGDWLPVPKCQTKESDNE